MGFFLSKIWEEYGSFQHFFGENMGNMGGFSQSDCRKICEIVKNKVKVIVKVKEKVKDKVKLKKY